MKNKQFVPTKYQHTTPSWKNGKRVIEKLQKQQDFGHADGTIV